MMGGTVRFRLGGESKETGRQINGPQHSDSAQTLRWCRDIVSRVGDLGPQLTSLDDEGLRALTGAYRQRLARGEHLDALLPEAFATVREAADRVLGQRPFDVQIMGGAVLHLGKITEMRTGEGKTLTATLPAYLHALDGAGVHVMTANEHLARRDAEWMRPVYEFLGLSAGLLSLTPPRTPTPSYPERREAYAADITYGTAMEFAYDYLRDNIAWETHEVVQRGHHFALVDEADLVLVDEMNTAPCVMTEAEAPEPGYAEFTKLAARLRPGEHYESDERARSVSLTDAGADAAEDYFGLDDLYGDDGLNLVYYLRNALIAKEHYRPGRDYLVEDGTIVIIDSASGRPEPTRTYGEGVQEAVLDKEGLPVPGERQVMAQVPIWDYLGQYELLAGMTGTAQEDTAVYRRVYQRDVVTIPTNKPMIRVDHPDRLYETKAAKLDALVKATASRHKKGQPILIGAASIEEARAVSALLDAREIGHQVLTALNHEEEAGIIAGAGAAGAVTVVAQMAGRGVDIVLGGGVADLGGLCVLGAERPVRRRLEMHLRGRAGRQGDPGESRFYLSLEDELITATFQEWNRSMMARPGINGLEFGMISRQLTKAQGKLAANEAERLVLAREWDRVLADQSRAYYDKRAPALRGDDLSGWFRERIDQVDQDKDPGCTRAAYARLESEIGSELMREAEQRTVQTALGRSWRLHLQAMPGLLKASTIRGPGPEALARYHREAAKLFDDMLEAAYADVVPTLFSFEDLLKEAASEEAG
jgi:preprotein translocase subunit SecA